MIENFVIDTINTGTVENSKLLSNCYDQLQLALYDIKFIWNFLPYIVLVYGNLDRTMLALCQIFLSVETD